MRACIKAWMSSKFGQMRPLVSMATDRVTVGKNASLRFLEHFCSDLFHTCRYDDIHNSLNEFEIGRDLTMDYRVVLLIYRHVIGHAGFLSSRASVKAIYGVCILLWGYGGLFPPRHSIMTSLFLRCNLRIVSHIVIGTRFCT